MATQIRSEHRTAYKDRRAKRLADKLMGYRAIDDPADAPLSPIQTDRHIVAVYRGAEDDVEPRRQVDPYRRAI